MHATRLWLPALFGALLLGGCASPYQGGGSYPEAAVIPIDSPQGRQDQQQGHPPSDQVLASISPRPAAVSSLIERAHDLRRAGDQDAALATLERALRISPRDGELYYELAVTHQQLKQPAQARQLAQRGLSLAQDEGTRRALRTLLSEL